MIARAAFLLMQRSLDCFPFLTYRAMPLGLMLIGLLAVPAFSFSQDIKPATSTTTPATGKPFAATSAKPVAPGPSWTQLTPAQQQALKPLATSWNALSEAQKRKWLEISKNYASLPPEGQATIHSRMNEWINLNPQQRAQARLNFGKTRELSKELTPDEKKAKWQAYQALSDEEKQKLAAKASPKPRGAATAIKPVAQHKLATVPFLANKPNATPAPKIRPQEPAISPAPIAPHASETAAGGVDPVPQR